MTRSSGDFAVRNLAEQPKFGARPGAWGRADTRNFLQMAPGTDGADQSFQRLCDIAVGLGPQQPFFLRRPKPVVWINRFSATSVKMPVHALKPMCGLGFPPTHRSRLCPLN